VIEALGQLGKEGQRAAARQRGTVAALDVRNTIHTGVVVAVGNGTITTDKRNAQLDAKMAAGDADWAEADADDAIDYAEWTVQNARLAVLDALDARAYAIALAGRAAD
jgi:co-chaperonin GroES (HSP10)